MKPLPIKRPIDLFDCFDILKEVLSINEIFKIEELTFNEWQHSSIYALLNLRLSTFWFNDKSNKNAKELKYQIDLDVEVRDEQYAQTVLDEFWEHLMTEEVDEE